jgi:hypothetical protein
MATRIKLRRDTTQNWTTVNPILANGEMGIEADTRRAKLGDGATAWMDLKYAITDQLRVDGKTVNSEMGVSIASQDPETWISTVRARGNWAGTEGVAYDSMGNLYLSGWEESGYNQVDPTGTGTAFLTKYDSKGNVLWSKYTHLDGYSNGYGVVVDSQDNSIVITVDDDNNFFAVSKFDMDGNLLWQKTVKDSYDYATGFCLAVDGNDDIIVAGLRGDNTHSGYSSLFVLKLTSLTGSIAWTKNWGAYSDTYTPSLAVDGSNNIIVAGNNHYDNGSGSDNNNHITLAKFNTNGAFVWSKHISNPENQYNGWNLVGASIDSDMDGNLYIVGSYEIPKFVQDLHGDSFPGQAALILKTDSMGVVKWSRLVGPGDCSDLGAQVVYNDGKLYATFQTEKPYYKDAPSSNAPFGDGYTTQEIVVASYDAANGKVLWQRNFGPEVLWGWANPTGTPESYQDRYPTGGRMLSVYKDYVAVAGQAGEYSRIDGVDTRSYGFVAQLPADGTEMDLAGWTYTESKHKGLYAKLTSSDDIQYTSADVTTITVTASNEYTPTDTADNVRIDLIASGANQWDFKPNGDLSLPVGGNIEITRATSGDIHTVGYFNEYNEYGVFNYYNSVTIDPEGNKYYVGCWNSHGNQTYNGRKPMPLIVKVNPAGEIEWKTRLSNSYLTDSNYSLNGDARTVAYDPSSGRIVVVAIDSSEGTADQMLVVDLDPLTGDVVEQHRYSAADDIGPNGMVINEAGERFITGSLQGSNYITFTVTNAMVVAADHTSLEIPDTVFAGHAIPEWKLGTNGWTVYDGSNSSIGNVSYIDYYDNISGTVRQGSGATFTVEYNSGSYAVSVVSAGIHYLPGHQIKVLGSLLGGVDSDNDLTITVASLLDSSGNIDAVTASGTPSETGSFPYTPIAGTNTNVGSGFTIGVQVDASTATNNLIVYHLSGGTHYVVNDVITFSGTQLGGTSPATDLVIKALQVGDSAGDVQAVENTGYQVITRGVSPLTYSRVTVASSPDFSTGGPWYLKNYSDANTFLTKVVSTATTSTNMLWAKWIEKSHYDIGVAVDYDSMGNIYWGSSVPDSQHVGSGDTFYRPLIVKLDSTGIPLWSKTYSLDGHEGYMNGLQVDSEDNVVLGQVKLYAGGPSAPGWYPIVRRIKGNGDLLYTREYLLYGGEGANGSDWNGGGLALDNDDNVYININRYDGEDSVQWTAKLDIQRLSTIWAQEISHEGAEYGVHHGWNYYSNSIATDGKTYSTALQTFDVSGNEGNALGVNLPADGSAADTHVGEFAINDAFLPMYYNSEGGYGTTYGDVPVARPYQITTATSQFTLVTNRNPISSIIDTSPVDQFPVYTNSEAGIVFGDGTKQTSSSNGIPQVKHGRYQQHFELKASDAGKHLYITNTDQAVIIPRYEKVQFPVGTVITIVNMSGGYVMIAGPTQDSGRTTIYCPALDGSEGSGDQTYLNGYKFHDNGGGCLITLLKVEESYSNGSRWVVTGNNPTQVTNW